ncbi:MAG: Multidrug resistance protein MdtC [Phycisphaerae bacterium]|nr:Multidrug resistance protein MdtC [Phycisphaerae bacterium]
MHTLADFILNRRGTLLVFAAIVTALAVAGERRLKFDEDPRNIIRSDDPEYARLEEIETTFGTDDRDCYVVIRAPEIFSDAVCAGLTKVCAALRGVEGVETVQSLLDVVDYRSLPPTPLVPPAGSAASAYEKSLDTALTHPLVAGHLMSTDGRTTLIVVGLGDRASRIETIRDVVARIESALSALSAEVPFTMQLTGVPALRAEVFYAMRDDQKTFTLVGIALGLGMAVFLFRRPTEIVIVGAASVVGALWTLGVMGWAGEKTNVINVITPTLILVIGFEDAIHVMLHIQRARAEGMSPREAARSAVARVGGACFMAALTTSIGFGSLVAAEAPLIRRLGVSCAVGAFLALGAVLVIVPTVAGGAAGKAISLERSRAMTSAFERFFERRIRPVLERPGRVVAVGAALTFVSVLLCTRLRPDNAWEQSVPSDSRTFAAWKTINDAFGGAQSVFGVITWPEGFAADSPEVLAAIGAAEACFHNNEATQYPLSVLSLARLTPIGAGDAAAAVRLLRLAPAPVPALLARFVSEPKRTALVTGRIRDTGERDAPLEGRLASLRAALSELSELHSGFTFHLTGTPAVADRSLRAMIGDLAASLASAAVVIFAVMALSFRSLRLGLISVLPNVLPLSLVGAALVVAGESLQIITVIVFSICLGLGVDNTIHLVNRFRSEAEADGDVRAAVRRSVRAVGWAIVTATLVLTTGFAGIVLSRIPSLRMFGALSCVALLASIGASLVLLPALLMLYARASKRTTPTEDAVQVPSK